VHTDASGWILAVDVTVQNGSGQNAVAVVPPPAAQPISADVLGRYAPDAASGSVQFFVAWHASHSFGERG
jgi:hypothetical protein